MLSPRTIPRTSCAYSVSIHVLVCSSGTETTRVSPSICQRDVRLTQFWKLCGLNFNSSCFLTRSQGFIWPKSKKGAHCSSANNPKMWVNSYVLVRKRTAGEDGRASASCYHRDRSLAQDTTFRTSL